MGQIRTDNKGSPVVYMISSLDSEHVYIQTDTDRLIKPVVLVYTQTHNLETKSKPKDFNNKSGYSLLVTPNLCH